MKKNIYKSYFKLSFKLGLMLSIYFLIFVIQKYFKGLFFQNYKGNIQLKIKWMRERFLQDIWCFFNNKSSDHMYLEIKKIFFFY